LALLVIVPAKRGKVLQLRHAPLFLPAYKGKSEEEKLYIANEFLSEMREIGKKYGCDFIRLQALVELSDSDNPFLRLIDNSDYRPANIHNIDAEKTLILDIDESEEELMMNMRKQTRYYIRKAGKMGVQVKQYDTLGSLEKFYKIHHDTTVRQEFKSYSHEYYQKSFEAFNSIPESKLSARVYLANYEGKDIAGAIIVHYGNRAFYSDGGSLTEYAKIPASYLIQWTAITDAKEAGCISYNFWGGVSPDKENKNYPWYGIDLFKRGFGGARYEYMHAHDLGLSWKYNLTRLWEYFERLNRGY
jgi:lipid II:glycine glycyltransferase (peptidoglycan interpeptide bridge formation enzyme)